MITDKGRDFLARGGNEAAIIDSDPELAEQIKAIGETYTRRIYPAINFTTGARAPEIRIEDGDTVIRYWTRTQDARREMQTQETRITYRPYMQTRAEYLAEVKAAFFDIAAEAGA